VCCIIKLVCINLANLAAIISPVAKGRVRAWRWEWRCNQIQAVERLGAVAMH
jgi:hypothetical protein